MNKPTKMWPIFFSSMLFLTTLCSTVLIGKESLSTGVDVVYISQSNFKNVQGTSQKDNKSGVPDVRVETWILGIFSGIGTVALVSLINYIRHNSVKKEDRSSPVLNGRNNYYAGRDVRIGQQITERERNDNYPLRAHPPIDLSQPIKNQVQLFATDKVKVYADNKKLKKVWFGANWETYDHSREYMVIGIRGVPIVPRFMVGIFLGLGEKEVKTSYKFKFKMEVVYTEDREKPRQLS